MISCLDCQIQHNSCSCFTCFLNGDHRTHKFEIKNSIGGGGVCDCGDIDSWKTSGNCKFHSGITKLHPSINKKLQNKFYQDFSKILCPLLYYCIINPETSNFETFVFELISKFFQCLDVQTKGNLNLLILVANWKEKVLKSPI